MNDSDYTKAEKVSMSTLFALVLVVGALTWFNDADGWLGWLGAALMVPWIVVLLRARRRVRRNEASLAASPDLP